MRRESGELRDSAAARALAAEARQAHRTARYDEPRQLAHAALLVLAGGVDDHLPLAPPLHPGHRELARAFAPVEHEQQRVALRRAPALVDLVGRLPVDEHAEAARVLVVPVLVTELLAVRPQPRHVLEPVAG